MGGGGGEVGERLAGWLGGWVSGWDGEDEW